ncbi:MAG: cytochrome P450 [Porticoccaceae bacterium]
MNVAAQALDIDLMDGARSRGLGIIDDFNSIREADPVFWSEKSQCWVVSRFEDVQDGFQCRKPLLNGQRSEFFLRSIPLEERAAKVPVLSKFVNDWIVNLDGPSHARLRKLMMQAFTKKIVEQFRPYARERVNFLLDRAIATPEIEFNEQIARPLPGYVIFKVLGLPEEYFPDLRNWANDTVEGTTVAMPPVESLIKADRAMASMNEVVLRELEKRKNNPSEDLLTTLMQAQEGGDKLSMDELFGAMHILIVAGHDTTSNTMTLGTEALARHPEAWQYLYENPDKAADCVNELMRYIAMSTGQTRLVGEDFEWHGKQLKKGQLVFLSIAGANRDPRAFQNPEKLDFQRDTAESQVFAPGIHHCIGHLLAKMQLVEFFSSMVQRFERLEVLDSPLQFMPTTVFRGMYRMNVRFHPRAS